MSRQAERIPPTRGERRRCEAGWRGGSCKKRTCVICGLVWAKDWRRVLFEALKSLGVPVALSAVTPPGWISSRGMNGAARIWARTSTASVMGATSMRRHSRRGHTTYRSAGSASTTPHATQPNERWAGACHSRPARGATGARARARPPRCSRSTRLRTCAWSSVTSRTWLAFAPKHKFGVVGQKRGVSLQIMDGVRAAAYLSSYFVRGNGGKATLQENARNPHLPHMLISVSPTLTRVSGVNMRNLRRCRQLWAVRLGLLPPPSWSGIELARVVGVAGPWPARGP
jgi:hypothetical protein